MKKSYWYVFLFLLIGLMTAGCFYSDEKNTTKSDIATKEMDEDAIVIGFSQVGSESDWRCANTESMKSTFTSEKGYYLIFADGQQKQENQLRDVRSFILQGVDYIILDPIVETGWDAVFQEAKEAGIPIILSDRTVELSDSELYTCQVGSDFVQEGKRAGEWLATYLEIQGRAEEEIRIVTLLGTEGSSAQIGRSEGFDLVLQEQKNWTMLGSAMGDFVQAKGREAMEELLCTYDDIDVVISQNDNMTFGAIDAIQAAGKTCGVGGDIIILSFDAAQDALEALKNGEINADFECNPNQGLLIEEVIQKLENGQEVEKIYYVEETYFDASMDLESIMKQRTY